MEHSLHHRFSQQIISLQEDHILMLNEPEMNEIMRKKFLSSQITLFKTGMLNCVTYQIFMSFNETSKKEKKFSSLNVHTELNESFLMSFLNFFFFCSSHFIIFAPPLLKIPCRLFRVESSLLLLLALLCVQ